MATRKTRKMASPTATKLPLQLGSRSDTSEGFGVATAVVPEVDVHGPDQVQVLIALVVENDCPYVSRCHLASFWRY